MTRIWRLLITSLALTLATAWSIPAASAAAPTLRIVAPAAGGTIAGSSVTVQVEVSGVTLRPPDGSVDPAFGHIHYFLDQQPNLSPGAIVPVGLPHIIHSPNTSVTFDGLAPGQHTIWVALGLGSHQLTTPVVADSVTFTIAPAAQPTVAPAPAAPQATRAPAQQPAASNQRPATTAPTVNAMPRTGAGGAADEPIPAWWALFSGLVVLVVAFGLRGILRRR
jgi:hypothetical protein